MKPLVLTLKERPPERLDLSPLLPHLLAGKTAAEIARIGVQTTRRPLVVGDVFRLRMGDVGRIHIEDGCDRLDWIGHGMADGEIVVDGDAGSQAGRLMTGGRVTITGSAGPWAASGMRGGVVIVRGDAGERTGDRLRRGTIVVEGRAGAWAGSRLIAGTLYVAGPAGPLPGYLMRRGTIVLGSPATLSPTFIDCGRHELIALPLLAMSVARYSARASKVLHRSLRRFAGDMAVLGKGEVFAAG